jgi:hypothetical protein
MPTDAPYIMDGGLTAARLLHRGGHWDDALAVLPAESPDALALRPEILVDRVFWRLDRVEEAGRAVAAVTPHDPRFAGYLEAQLAHTRLVFGLDPEPGDRARARAGFAAAADDDRLAGWAVFWQGVLAENVDADLHTAGTAYERALATARRRGDALLESYVVRHQAGRLPERDRKIALLQRSYHLRATLGARPQTAAAAVTLAEELDGPDAGELRSAAALTARELGLTWLLRAL